MAAAFWWEEGGVSEALGGGPVQGGVGYQAVCKCDQAELQGGSQGDPWSQRPLQGGHHHQGGQHHHHGVDKPPLFKITTIFLEN